MPRPPLSLGVQTMRGRFQGQMQKPLLLGYPEPARVGIEDGDAAGADLLEDDAVVAQNSLMTQCQTRARSRRNRS